VNLSGNDITNAGSISADTLEAETLSNDYHFARSFAGADPNARLDNAITAADNGDTIYLENTDYNGDTLSFAGGELIGTGQVLSGTKFIGDLTLTNFESIKSINMSLNTLTIQDGSANISNIGSGNIQINGDGVNVSNCQNVDVVFGSGTQNGAANLLVGGSTATDNGSNKIGSEII
jgi:hypothetical protein